MTQRNTFPQTIQTTPAGVADSPCVALGLSTLAVIVIIALITVQLGAGFGYV